MDHEALSIYDILAQYNGEDEKHDQFERIKIPLHLCERIIEKDKTILQSVQKAINLRLHLNGGSAKLEPAAEFYGEWRTVGPQDLNEEDKNNLLLLQRDKLPLFFRARISDVLWIKWHIYSAAIDAIDSYHMLFKHMTNIKIWYKYVHIVERALFISRQIRNGEKKKDLINTLHTTLIKYKTSAEYSFLNKLIEILISEQKESSEDYLQILYDIRKSYDGPLTTIPEETFDLERQYYLSRNDRRKADETQIHLAEYHEKTAEKQDVNSLSGLMIATNHLRIAYSIYMKHHKTDKAQEAITKLDKIQEKEMSLLQQVTTEHDVKRFFTIIESELADLNDEECLVYLMIQAQPVNKKNIKNRVENNCYAFSSLATIDIVDLKGRVISRLPSLEAVEPEKYDQTVLMHMFHEAAESADRRGFFLSYAINLILEKHNVTKHILSMITERNGMIPEGREEIVLSALEMFFQGKKLESMYILVPQVEHIIRVLASELGAVTTIIKDEAEEELSLGKLFNSQELIDGYDEDVLFTLRSLLIEGAGGNIRNEIAHGMFDELSAKSNIVTYFFCFIMTFLGNTSKRCQDVLRNSEALNNILNNHKDSRQKKKQTYRNNSDDVR